MLYKSISGGHPSSLLVPVRPLPIKNHLHFLMYRLKNRDKNNTTLKLAKNSGKCWGSLSGAGWQQTPMNTVKFFHQALTCLPLQDFLSMKGCTVWLEFKFSGQKLFTGLHRRTCIREFSFSKVPAERSVHTSIAFALLHYKGFGSTWVNRESWETEFKLSLTSETGALRRQRNHYHKYLYTVNRDFVDKL